MCSISVFYNSEIVPNSENLMRYRGPDREHSITKNKFYFKHYLLSLTGDMVKQPIENNDVICLFNGEIYNYKEFGEFESDVFSIVQSYKNYGDDFVKMLDGEFSLFLIDFEKNIFYMSSDIFGTKPLFYSLENGFGLASQQSFLEKNGYKNIQRIQPNTTLKFDLEFNLISKTNVYDFSLEEFVDNFDQWNDSFLKSIQKRFMGVNHEIILPLSSGHDSGGIACALNILEIPYISYSILGQENSIILNDRIKMNRYVSYYSEKIDREICDFNLQERCEPFYYGKDYNSKEMFGFDDPGSKGLSFILSEIKKRHPNVKILASGQGSDEIMSNNQNYSFGGSKNPAFYNLDTLKKTFPWQNFYEGANYSYLNKEESISGSFGIEGRYPFLDKDVVQSYLNLLPELKNMYFKSPLTNFLMKNRYPINNIKQGFNPSL